MKEKQSLYYRRKCEQYLDDIDILVNSKISQKGGQLIYELDVATRELRVLKDNYKLMQTIMMEDLRTQFSKTIHEYKNCIVTLKDVNKKHATNVSNEIENNVREIF